MSAELSRRLKAYDVTLAQLQLLKQLWKQEGRSQAELQELLELDRATVAGLVQRMTAQNLIERRPDPVDKRIQRVFTTERGRSLRGVPAALEEEVTAKALQGFSEDERTFLTSLLARALQNIEAC
jgi:DNA-binding MarR family transcriptional regulator